MRSIVLIGMPGCGKSTVGRRLSVEKAVEAGVVSLNEEIEEFTTDIRMIVIGNVFEWCVKHGKADFEGNMSRSLGKYLDAVLCPAGTDKV